MRRGHYIAAFSLLIAVFTLSFASTALAGGTPHEICKDLHDNGKLDGHYTPEELAAFITDPTVQGYCGPLAHTVTPAITSTKIHPIVIGEVQGVRETITSPKTHAVKGERQTVGAPKRSAPLAATRSAGTLPFTGAELALFGLVGLALVGTGLLLRTTTRQRS